MSNFTRQCATTTMDFETVQAVIKADESEVLGRSEGQQAKYVEEMAAIRSRYEKVSDYIKISKFGYDGEVSPESGKLMAIAPDDGKPVGTEDIVL